MTQFVQFVYVLYICAYLCVKVRVYDPVSSVRRPVLSVSVEDSPLTSLCLQTNSPQYVTLHCYTYNYSMLLYNYSMLPY